MKKSFITSGSGSILTVELLHVNAELETETIKHQRGI